MVNFNFSILMSAQRQYPPGPPKIPTGTYRILLLDTQTLKHLKHPIPDTQTLSTSHLTGERKSRQMVFRMPLGGETVSVHTQSLANMTFPWRLQLNGMNKQSMSMCSILFRDLPS